MINEKYCIDEYISDQVLIFMALADGYSEISIPKDISLHFQTMIEILRRFINVDIQIRKENCFNIIGIKGINFIQNI